jgi:hypothetical protein
MGTPKRKGQKSEIKRKEKGVFLAVWEACIVASCNLMRSKLTWSLQLWLGVAKDQVASTSSMHTTTLDLAGIQGSTHAGIRGKRNKENFHGIDN